MTEPGLAHKPHINPVIFFHYLTVIQISFPGPSYKLLNTMSGIACCISGKCHRAGWFPWKHGTTEEGKKVKLERAHTLEQDRPGW